MRRNLEDQLSIINDQFNSETDSSPLRSEKSFMTDLPLRETNCSINNVINGVGNINGVFLKRKQSV